MLRSTPPRTPTPHGSPRHLNALQCSTNGAGAGHGLRVARLGGPTAVVLALLVFACGAPPSEEPSRTLSSALESCVAEDGTPTPCDSAAETNENNASAPLDCKSLCGTFTGIQCSMPTNTQHKYCCCGTAKEPSPAHVGSRLPRVAHVVPDGRKWRGSAQGA
jgi:hypothetical protein